MTLKDLVAGMDGVRILGDEKVEITSVSYDSRRVQPGGLYVAITGLRTDGRRFAPEAVRNAAAAIACQDAEGLPDEAAGKAVILEVPDARKFLAEASARLEGYPDREMTVIGVTGTNGKTTFTYVMESILRTAGWKTAIVGTTGFFDGESWNELTHTTPESTDLWKMLGQFRDGGCAAAAIEISSHAIALERVWGLDVDVAVFTNLTQDHLDFHTDMEDYKETKFRLFTEMKPGGTAVINIDDEAGRKFVERLADRNMATFSVGSRDADLWVEVEDANLGGSAVVVHYKGLALPVEIKLPGLHNVSNTAAAVAVGLIMGIEPDDIKAGVEKLMCVPGRFEPVSNPHGFFIFIDYAHTPDALKHLIGSARELGSARIVTLFGCGGDRDASKRPKMGRIAAELSDYVFVTSDNPRTEDPQKIITEILTGVDTDAKQVMLDRKQAIFAAVKFLEPGDVLLVAGKGHEDYQILGTQKIHFDDREVVMEALDALA